MARHSWTPCVLLVAACALQISASATQSRDSAAASHPDLSGTWVRLRQVKYFMDNSVTSPDMSHAGERLTIDQDAAALTIRDAVPGVPVKRFIIGGSGERTNSYLITTHWETNPDTKADTLVIVARTDTGVTIGGAPGSSEQKDEWWLDPFGTLMSRSSDLAWPKGSEKPARSHVMTERAYLRENLISGITRVGLAVDVSGDSDACGFTRQKLTEAITRSSSGAKILIETNERVSDAPELRILIHSDRSETPVTRPPVVISVVNCTVSMAVEIVRPTGRLYRDSVEFTGSPPDVEHWVTAAAIRNVDEFATAVKFANQRSPARNASRFYLRLAERSTFR